MKKLLLNIAATNKTNTGSWKIMKLKKTHVANVKKDNMKYSYKNKKQIIWLLYFLTNICEVNMDLKVNFVLKENGNDLQKNFRCSFH